MVFATCVLQVCKRETAQCDRPVLLFRVLKCLRWWHSLEPYNRIQLSGLPYFLEAIGSLGREFGATECDLNVKTLQEVFRMDSSYVYICHTRQMYRAIDHADKKNPLPRSFPVADVFWTPATATHRQKLWRLPFNFQWLPSTQSATFLGARHASPHLSCVNQFVCISNDHTLTAFRLDLTQRCSLKLRWSAVKQAKNHAAKAKVRPKYKMIKEYKNIAKLIVAHTFRRWLIKCSRFAFKGQSS